MTTSSTLASAKTLGADWSAVPGDHEAGRLLLSARVSYCGRVFFLLSLAFYLRNIGLMALMEGRFPPLAHPTLLLHLAAMIVALAQWLSCRRGKRSLAQLRMIDAGSLLTSMVLYGALTIAEASSFEHAIAVESAGAEVLLVGLITLAFVLTRAIIVPATVQRTFWISTAAAAIGPLAAYGVAYVGFPAEALAEKPWLPLNQALYVAMWAIFAVVVATIAARVIHGLQQRVREANELGQYRLTEKIGEGGMGSVYLAQHALLRRPTAIKVLSADRAGEHAIRRFEQEVQLTSALTHPNTIAIYDFGRTPDGLFYYAMEYLDGVTLHDLVAHAGPQPAARVVHMLRQICSALSEAHDLGLVHRDIKPANLMVCTRGGIPDQIKVLDFGLVKEQSADTSLSLAGMLVGTPSYLPPEAIREPGTVEPRSDLYAVGAVGYYLLTGAPVFEGRTIVEVCAKHLQSEPDPISKRTSDVVPEALESLIMRCLAKEPSQRYPSASALVLALEAVPLAAPWSVGAAARWWAQNGSTVRSAAQAERGRGATPGPLTLAIDPARKDVSAFS